MVEVGIRPHAIELIGTGGMPATVVLVERLGGTSLVHARVDGLPALLTVELPGSYAAAPDTLLHLHLDPERMHVFDRNGAALI